MVFTIPSVPLIGDRNLREKEETAPPVALNRCALRLAGHQSPRQDCFSGDEPAGVNSYKWLCGDEPAGVNTYKMVVRDGTAGAL